jgi:hypothetical protein
MSLYTVLKISKSPESSLSNKSSFLALAFDVTKLTIAAGVIWPHFEVILKSDLDVQLSPPCSLSMTFSIFLTGFLVRQLSLLGPKERESWERF